MHSTATVSVFIGAMTGQLVMGSAGDILGRTAAMTLTLSLVALGSLLCSVAAWGEPSQVYGTIIVSRFILGIGVGGVYPLSATKATEDSGDSHHGVMDPAAAAWAFFWQVPGSMVRVGHMCFLGRCVVCVVFIALILRILRFVLTHLSFDCSRRSLLLRDVNDNKNRRPGWSRTS